MANITKCLLLDEYHRRQTLSMLPNGYAPYFQLGQIQWGYGLIDDSGADPLLEDIPSDLTELESVFATSDAAYTYINGKIVIVATLPKDQIPAGESRKWSMVGLLDGDGVLVGAVVKDPQDVTNQQDVSVTLEIDTVDETKTLQVK